MSRLVVLSLLLACRAEVEPVATPTPSPTPDPTCEAFPWEGEVLDCSTLDPCAPDLTLQLACCTCDASFCEPLTCVPPELPPDVGPEVAFDRPVQVTLQSLQSSTVELTFTPDHVLVSSDPGWAEQADCTRTGNTVTCAQVVVYLGFSSVYLNEFDLRLEDGDGDGRVDGGLLRAVGGFSGPMLPMNPIATVAPLRLDGAGVDARLPAEVLPTRPVVLELGELGLDGPIPTLRVGAETRELEAIAGVGGLVAYRTVDAQAVLPWGAELSVDGALFDLSGNPVEAQLGSVVADPGPWTDNPGFEGTGGWVGSGFDLPFPDPGFDPSWLDADPWEGTRAAYAYSGGILVGQASIPADASTLTFAFRSGGPYLPAGTLTVVTPANERAVIWEVDTTDATVCDGGIHCLPWAVQSADVSAWAGQSVYLELELRADTPITATLPPSPPAIHAAVDGFAFE